MGYSAMSKPDFEAVFARLQQASDALFKAGAYSQAVARRYYMVYHVACFAAQQTGLQVAHHWDRASPTSDYRHDEVPDIVETLYCGNKKFGSCVVSPGGTRGVTGSAMTEKQAWTMTEKLKGKRIAADYYGGPIEPLTENEAKGYFAGADQIVKDIRGLL